MSQLSERLNRLSPSATLAMSQKSNELKAQGVDVINMSVGEPDFNTPEHIKEAAKQAIDENFSKYTPVNGIMEFRQAVCHYFKRQYDVDSKPENVIITQGSLKEGHTLTDVQVSGSQTDAGIGVSVITGARIVDENGVRQFR